MSPDLTQLTDQPELSVPIGGRRYLFSELPLSALARLQTWVNDHTPHPVDSLRGHLDGLPDHVAVAMGEAARNESKAWPPQVGTSAGAIALLSTEPGQIQTLFEGLAAHEPGVTLDDAYRVYRGLRREAAREVKAAKRAGRKCDGEGTVQRVFAVLFGLDDGDESLPKG